MSGLQLVMEHVEGMPLAAYCQRRRLSLPERLRLCARVAAALHVAHARGAVHGRLRPEGILVGEDGTPKILGFGGGGGFAPDHASPEQIGGHAATPRSDVFSLGVVVFEVLTHLRPYELAGLPTDEALACMRTAPLPPSRRALRHGLPYDPALLAGDIDRAVLRAMAANPADRHDSALAFGQDLERLATASEVAGAGRLPPPARLLGLRWNTRLLSVAAGVGLAAGLAWAATGGLMPGAPAAEQALQPAQRMSAVADTLPLVSTEHAVALRDRAMVAFRAGQHAEAEAFMQECIVVRRALVEARAGDPLESARLAWSLNYLADILLARGAHEAALATVREAVDINSSLAGHGPPYRIDLALSLETMGRVEAGAGRRDRACGAFNGAVQALRRAQPGPGAKPPERYVAVEAALRQSLPACEGAQPVPRNPAPDRRH